MKPAFKILAFFCFLFFCETSFGAELLNDYPVKPVSFTEVSLNDEFWAPRIETNRTVTIPYAFEKCEETGRIENFVRAARVLQNDATLTDRKVRGYSFDDTDPYKVLEGASFGLSVKPDARMDTYLDELIAKIASAQEEDGYLFTARTINPEDPHEWAGKRRWVNVKRLSHELYNMGHLYEAAVAHYQATGKRTLLDIAIKNANLLCEVFGPGKNEDAPGHQIIEMGLVKLYRTTGEEKYLKLAKFFLDTRGPDDGQYSQAHKRIVEQDEAVGHAVRATYMYSGIADVAALTNDQEYIKAIDRIWDNVVSKKFYITGGVGATGGGEAFGRNYELPNMSAYCETCAAIGNVYWNHRLFLLSGDGKYIDVMERTLYNGLISGVSLEGTHFFYPNPLASQGQHRRSPWFGCACCPGNITRFIASVPGYFYAHKDDCLYVNLFSSGNAEVSMKHVKVQLKQKTRYPWDGEVEISVNPEKAAEFKLLLRMPGWARNEPVPSDLYRFMNNVKDTITVKVNDEDLPLNLEKGYAVINRNWKKGDIVKLQIPMPIRHVLANEKVEDDRGRVAIQRGPIVYCVEWPDNIDINIRSLQLTDEIPLTSEYKADMFDGVQVVNGTAYECAYAEDGQTLRKTKQNLMLIPYYAWAHRGPGEMAVWLAREESAVRPVASPTIASQSKVTTSGGTDRRAMKDQDEPRNSNDHSCRFFHWWPKKGTTEWVQYTFAKPETVSRIRVYWFDDTGQGECRIPKSWRILYLIDNQWKAVQSEDVFGVEKDRYNEVTFEPVTTEGLRLEVQLQERFSAGIQEWQVK